MSEGNPRRAPRRRAREPTLEAKLAFLRRAESYPGTPAEVRAVETHLSWVFFTPSHAYKLKKPVRRNALDYRHLHARLLNCRREVALNRRLAPTVYVGLVALKIDAKGRMHLGAGAGRVVEWLVVMRRLPDEKTLRSAIAAGKVDRPSLQRLIARLADFFGSAPSARMRGKTYLSRLVHGIRAVDADLRRHRPPGVGLNSLLRAQLDFVDRYPGLISERARRVVEGHGDLRPEHIYLLDPPQVIDCLEFNRDLRRLDPFDELAFLAMECEFLHAPQVGQRLLSGYASAAGDAAESVLVDFYMCRNACIRAALSLSHLDDSPQDSGKWRRRANAYLAVASRHAEKMLAPQRKRTMRAAGTSVDDGIVIR